MFDRSERKVSVVGRAPQVSLRERKVSVVDSVDERQCAQAGGQRGV